MINLTAILLAHWQHTLQPFGVDPIIANQLFPQLVAIYSSPSRHYHTLQHIHYVLSKIDVLQNYVQDLASVQLAAWFHDVIYDTHLQDNEERSADYAVEMLNTLAIPTSTTTKVKNLIMATKNHQAQDIDSQVLLDADLAILAAESVEYQKYAKAIRQEYAWVSDAEYITGRRQVLERFLQRQCIYFTPLMLESAEELARLNIKQELFPS
ncbi:hypothetical protein [Anabaena azotica]|uniref:HD domain-containing protein n=1 Tax=Anabaena azotica TaxID=197653 RepID=UPI0039A6DD14